MVLRRCREGRQSPSIDRGEVWNTRDEGRGVDVVLRRCPEGRQSPSIVMREQSGIPEMIGGGHTLAVGDVVLIRCLNARRRPFTLKEGAAAQIGRLSPSVVRENGMHRDACGPQRLTYRNRIGF